MKRATSLIIAAGLAVVLMLAAPAQATLLQWNTFGNSGTETTEPSVFNAPNISSSILTLGAGVSPASNLNRFGGSNWFDTGDTNPTTLAESIAGNDYIEFIVTPSPGWMFTVTDLTYIWDRSATGPTSVTLRSSLDGYATDLGTTTGLPSGTFATQVMSVTGIVNVTSATTFRLYGYGATNAAGTGGFDTNVDQINVSLNGRVDPIPEPSTYMLLGFGGLGLALLARRRVAVA